jgi:hypothetical protein
MIRENALLPAQSAMVTEMPEGLFQIGTRRPSVRSSSFCPALSKSRPATGRPTNAVRAMCFSPTMWAASAIAVAPSAARVLFVHLPPEAVLGS